MLDLLPDRPTAIHPTNDKAAEKVLVVSVEWGPCEYLINCRASLDNFIAKLNERYPGGGQGRRISILSFFHRTKHYLCTVRLFGPIVGHPLGPARP